MWLRRSVGDLHFIFWQWSRALKARRSDSKCFLGSKNNCTLQTCLSFLFLSDPSFFLLSHSKQAQKSDREREREWERLKKVINERDIDNERDEEREKERKREREATVC